MNVWNPATRNRPFHGWRAPLRVGVAFALAVMLLRAVVPAGLMFSPGDQSGLLSITLCSGSGPVQITLDLNDGAAPAGAVTQRGDKQDGSHRGTSAPCVFSVLAPLASPVSPVFHFMLTEVARPSPFSDGVDAGVDDLAAPPPLPTGPPVAR